MIVCAGVLFTVIFQVFTPEAKPSRSISYERLGKLSNESQDSFHSNSVHSNGASQSAESLQNRNITWTAWLKEPQFYQVRETRRKSIHNTVACKKLDSVFFLNNSLSMQHPRLKWSVTQVNRNTLPEVLVFYTKYSASY